MMHEPWSYSYIAHTRLFYVTPAFILCLVKEKCTSVVSFIVSSGEAPTRHSCVFVCVHTCVYMIIYMHAYVLYMCAHLHMLFTGARFLAPGSETDSTCATRPTSTLHGPALYICPGILPCQRSTVVKCWMRLGCFIALCLNRNLPVSLTFP